ncbi:MAG: exodeoxyribonuclease VII large subunit [Pseudomonadota bacterium]
MEQNDLFATREVLKPSDLNRRVRLLLEGQLGDVWLEGEISNLSTPPSGHAYFTLKDAQAQVRCALFKNRNVSLPLKAGQQILVRARVSLYQARGEFQLIVDEVEAAGEGLLRAQFEALKKQLAAEGLFDEARKRELPPFPRHLAVITSPSGAALKDVLSVLTRRYPTLRVTVVPSLVQGDRAPVELRRGLARAVALQPDLVLLTRGGGSLEDLWAFNDEGLARDLAAAAVPTISAVGHEVDFSISDFVADVRAPTPSAAAELLAPDSDELRRIFLAGQQRLQRSLRGRLQEYWLRLGEFERRLQTTSPAAHITAAQQRRRELRDRMTRDQRHRLQQLALRVNALTRRLKQASPARRVEQAAKRLSQLKPRLKDARQRADQDRRRTAADFEARLHRQNPSALIDRLGRRLEERTLQLSGVGRRELTARKTQLAAVSRALQAVSPLAVLDRGYSVTRTAAGAVVRSAAEVKQGDPIVIDLKADRVRAVVDEIESREP